MNKYIKSFLLVAAVSGTLVACKKQDDPTPEEKGEVHFNFKNYAGEAALQLGTASYTTPQNEEITVSKFNYYISNIKLMNTEGGEYAEPESYHLLQQDKLGSLHFHLANVPGGKYKSVSFLIGVDEARNTSGAQTGALDPINGMFWDWNTGYIMAKMEGTSPQSKDSTKKFMLHVGGFNGEFNSLRTVTLDFPAPIEVSATESGDLVVKADALKWFAPTAIRIAERNTFMMPSATTKAMADNYSKMFTLQTAQTVAAE
jgi:hypothetical protein